MVDDKSVKKEMKKKEEAATENTEKTSIDDKPANEEKAEEVSLVDDKRLFVMNLSYTVTKEEL
jgi:RNA recognition motif-containing protein